MTGLEHLGIDKEKIIADLQASIDKDAEDFKYLGIRLVIERIEE